ncbi:MAG: hypothetical protein FJ271_09365 [Planctomycetes bacterium]|nr:hypothetical protein [Planctomycetota bacterium]
MRCWHISLWLLGMLTSPAAGQEWTRFRGPNGSGLSTARSLPFRWTESDVAWKVKLAGTGHSSPVLWGNKIFVTSGNDKTGTRIVQCLENKASPARERPQFLWQKEYSGPVSGKHADNSFASATPAVDERQVYVTFASAKDYLVIALDHAGKEAWRIDLGPSRAGHGCGASPIVHDGMVIVPNDQDGKSCAVALDTKSGKVRWRIERKSRTAYGTPCIFQQSGKPAELILVSYEQGFTSIDPRTGQTNWEADVFSKKHVEGAIASPIIHGNLVLGTCGWLGVQYETVALAPRADGKRPKVTYRIEKVAPLVPTPLVQGDLLFLWNDRGVVTCADAEIGKTHWRERVPGSYYGSPVFANGHLYAMSREGDVVVLAADRKFRLVARNLLGEGSHSTPAIAGETLYLRTFTHLAAIRAGKPR